ncbi:MAG TPA: hypothetical protein VG013_34235 [Gemmataceae bacterium]|jgi:hypothetical protein|nr:hypothetical protein [Gemmataceae bacterium]
MRAWRQATCLVLILAGVARAGDQPRDIVARAIKVAGAEARLARLKAVTWKGKGTLYRDGVAIRYTVEGAFQVPDKSRLVLEGTADGRAFNIVSVVNGDKAWVGVNGKARELDKDRLAEAREQVYVDQLSRLAPLTDDSLKLAALGEVKVHDQPALGVRVNSKGHREVNLFFDKDTGLLVKTAHRVRDESGKEVSQETFYSDYKAADGVQEAMKITIKRDGKPYVEAVMSGYKLREKLEDRVFARP